MKKIAVITGTRAEYGLLKPLIQAIDTNDSLDLQLVVTAMHLSPEYGMTINEIIKDGFPIVKKIESLLSSDSAVGITKSISLAMASFAETFDEQNPDIIVILGDRTEMLAAAIAANMANIPIAHIHGGETTEGAYDEGIRHAITKMSYWHFTSAEEYRQRVIQLGEHPERCYNVGAVGLDSIKNLPLLSKTDFETQINFKLTRKTALVTYHPVTLESSTAESQFQTILDALDSTDNLNIIFTHANSDKDGKIINEMIVKYVKDNEHKSVEFKSLGQLRYLSALKYVDLVVGNSSSGIIEVPYYNIPTLNIGDRQKGRVAPISVLNIQPNASEIKIAINKALSAEFLSDISKQDQLYGDGNSTDKIMSVLTETKEVDLKKSFYDLNLNS
jgi:GDP/UDP-N,N'-diacetylbacillosamine 2-epimerase (hydrolysing)|tara:strand:+ start:670 stop:1833 length:1164 start_codon:yes stop_codon:yes gene_type:complete